jgi:hypothetical protein
MPPFRRAYTNRTTALPHLHSILSITIKAMAVIVNLHKITEESIPLSEWTLQSSTLFNPEKWP